MAGRVLVWAEAPPLRRAGKLTVVIDGTEVGKVQQGEVAPFTVEPGTHTVQLRAGGGRSNTVTVKVADGGTSRVANYSTGISTVAMALPLLGFVLAWIPGLIFRLQVQTREPAPAPAPAGPVSPGAANGLWWESDPVLSKRLRAAGPSGKAE